MTQKPIFKTSTIGFMTDIEGFSRPIQIRFEVYAIGDVYEVSVVRAHTLSKIKTIPTKRISHDDLEELMERNNIDEFRNFCELFDFSPCI